jgi:hypothetical protein
VGGGTKWEGVGGMIIGIGNLALNTKVLGLRGFYSNHREGITEVGG